MQRVRARRFTFHLSPGASVVLFWFVLFFGVCLFGFCLLGLHLGFLRGFARGQ